MCSARLAAVANHPNRSGKGNKTAGNPSPAQVRRAREAAGLTLEQAGALVYTSWRTFQNWEADAGSTEHRRMHPSTWELFQLKLKAWQMVKNGRLAPQALEDLGLPLPPAK